MICFVSIEYKGVMEFNPSISGGLEVFDPVKTSVASKSV